MLSWRGSVSAPTHLTTRDRRSRLGPHRTARLANNHGRNPKEPPTKRLALRAVASIVAGLVLGAAAVFGVTLIVQQDAGAAQPQRDPSPSVPNLVEYGDRCFHGHCLPNCWHGYCLP
jgi:Protein of unknown function (DUF2613)